MTKSTTNTVVLGTRPGNRDKPEDTLFSWLVSLEKTGVKNLSKQATTLAIQIGVVLVVHLVLKWQTINQFIPTFIYGPVVFLTATSTEVIPRTIYWVIFFTFGKNLVKRIQETGFLKAMQPIQWLGPELKKAFASLKNNAYPLFWGGIGVGLIIANNFSSYGLMLQAGNRIGKYFIALVISFTISYLLGEGRKHWLFKFSRLSASDLSRWLKFESHYSDNHTYIILSGFVVGLLADAPLILFHWDWGEYILGVFLIAGAIALAFRSKAPKAKQNEVTL